MKGTEPMAPALAQEKIYTIDDIYSLPDGEHAELIDGQIYYTAPPNRKHQTIARELFSSINSYNISVICDSDKLTDKGCSGAPDWIIEIVSPSSRRMDYFTKLFKYRTAGVREYWIVDPDQKRITVYDFESEDIRDYGFSDTVKAGIYDNLYINFSDIAELLNI